MSTKLFQATNLGSLDNIIFIIKMIIESPKAVPLRDLKKYCTGKSVDLAYSIDGIVTLLTSISWCKLEENNKLYVGKKVPTESLRKEDITLIRHKLIVDIFSSLKSGGVLQDFIDLNSVDYDKNRLKITVSQNAIPLSASGLKNLLISIGFLNIDSNKPHLYFIDDNFQSYFESEILSWLCKITAYTSETGLTYDKFKDLQKAKEAAGFLAEEFVLNYEKIRLAGHPLIFHIRQISRIKVDAGYDVISFNSLTSKTLDRYIEIKSFTGKPSFYWSRNEVEISRLQRKRYFLYLVDREKIDKLNYQPIIYRDPYKSLFNQDEWTKEPQNWFFWKKL